MDFVPDYRHFRDVMNNQRSSRLTLYEHAVSGEIMESIQGESFAALYGGDATDILEYRRQHCRFFRDMTYDVVTYDMNITDILPGGGALSGGKAGPIQTRADFEAYPWDELPILYWRRARPHFDALAKVLPAGMKGVGGPGNGVFEISEDLVGLEYLPFMEVDDPDLYAELFEKIGDLMVAIWTEFLERYAGHFVACRFGDDLGFKSSLLTHPSTIRKHVIPQYIRIIDLIHAAGLPFLYHSCGCIFEVMDDILALDIQAKHSNEDTIAPFDRWIRDYGDRIALLGGFDMDFLCRQSEQDVYARVIEDGARFRRTAQGYALGSGNSIPTYVPVENYRAMVRAGQVLRAAE